MALNSVYFRKVKQGRSISLPTSASSTVVAGKGTTNADGYAILMDTLTEFAGISTQTPSFDGEVVEVMIDGEIYIKDDGSNTYIDASTGAPDDGDPIYIVAAGMFTSTTGSNLKVGNLVKVIGTNEWIVKLDGVTATAAYT